MLDIIVENAMSIFLYLGCMNIYFLRVSLFIYVVWAEDSNRRQAAIKFCVCFFVASIKDLTWAGDLLPCTSTVYLNAFCD